MSPARATTGKAPRPGASAASDAPADVAAALQRLLDRTAGRRRIPHAVMALERGDGSLRWAGAAGEARPGVPMRPDTPYVIASVTKLYIAATVLRLHEQNRIALDEPMVRYLPGGLVAGLHRLDGVDRTGEITVRNLLSHTSGLPDFLEDGRRGERTLLDRVGRGEDMSWELEDAVRIAREIGPRFPPRDLAGERVKGRYSDTGFQLLIGIAEAVTGRTFQEVLDQEILRPLGLRRTFTPGAAGSPEPAAIWSRGRPLDIPLALASFKDLVSTAGETLAFVRALVAGQVFADPSTAGLMQQRWIPIGYPLQYGLGMMRFRVNRLIAPGRRPVTLVGHSGASGSWAFHCPERDVFLAGTVDRLGARGLPFRLMARALRIVTR